MPRGNEKDAFFFAHDCNARNDPKVLALRSVYGAEGYGVYFMLIEILREQPEYKLPLNKYIWNNLAFQTGTDAKWIKQLVQDCCTEFSDAGHPLLVNDGEFLYSRSLLRRMAKMESVKERYRLAARRRWEQRNGMDCQGGGVPEEGRFGEEELLSGGEERTESEQPEDALKDGAGEDTEHILPAEGADAGYMLSADGAGAEHMRSSCEAEAKLIRSANGAPAAHMPRISGAGAEHMHSINGAGAAHCRDDRGNGGGQGPLSLGGQGFEPALERPGEEREKDAMHMQTQCKENKIKEKESKGKESKGEQRKEQKSKGKKNTACAAADEAAAHHGTAAQAVLVPADGKDAVFLEFAGGDGELLEALRAFAGMRQAGKKPLTAATARLLLGELEKLSPSPREQVRILNRSTAAGWTGVYPLAGTRGSPGKRDAFGALRELHSEYGEAER